MKQPTNTPGEGRPITDLDGDGKPIDPRSEIPVDDGDADNRSQLTRLALSGMGVQPERSCIPPKGTGQQVLQAIVFGQITGLTGPKELPNAKNEAEKFTYGLVGRIEGVNAISGEMFKAGVLYLPGGFHDLFLAEIEAGLKSGSDVAIAFALEFWSIPASNPRGYSWKAVNKLPMEKADPLARLRQRALAGTQIKGLTAAPEQAKLTA